MNVRNSKKRAKKFIFGDVSLSSDRKTVKFEYHSQFNDADDISFAETLKFNERLPQSENITKALKFYHICAGVSYYKAHLAPEISSHGLDPWASEAMSDIYLNGLGEFLYMNDLAPDEVAWFVPQESQRLPTTHMTVKNDDWLVPIGGGKDSLTTTTILEQTGQDFRTFRANSNRWVDSQLTEIGVRSFKVQREIDPFLISDAEQVRGHIPITVIISAISIIAALLEGNAAVVFSNEASADEPTVADYRGLAVNHQWAKSTQAEELIQSWVTRYISADLEVFSLLRDMSELDIAELFAKAALPRYSGLWSSSNSNFRQDSSGKLDWDLMSPKTCTVFLLLAPFVEREVLISEFGGNPLEIKENSENWAKLLGKTDTKPFECVATIEEMQQAKQLAEQTGQWPELKSI